MLGDDQTENKRCVRLYITLAINIHELLIHQQFDDLLGGKARVHGHYSSRIEGEVLDRSRTDEQTNSA